MKDNSPLRPVTWGVRIAAGLAMLVGVFWLAAWFGGWTAPWSAAGAIILKTNMALCLLFGGIALLMLEQSSPTRVRRAIGAALALIVLLVGALTLSEHLFRYDLGIDQLLAKEAPGAAATASPNRMGPPGSACLVLLGTGLLALALGRRRFVPYLGLAVCTINLVPAVGFLYGIAEFFSLPHTTGIAWPTVASLLALGGGLVLTQRKGSRLGLLVRDDAGGALIRRLLPAVILIPLALGYLRVHIQSRGFVTTAGGTGLFVIIMILLIAFFLWRAAAALSRSATAEAEALRAARASEAVLRESEQKYRTIVETAGEGVVLARPWGSYSYVNQRMADMLGYPVEEILGKSNLDFTFDGWQPQVLQARTELRKGDVISGEFKFRRKDGSVVWSAYNTSPIFNEKGEHVANLTMHTDITKRKQAELEIGELMASVQQERDKLSALVGSIPDEVWFADTQKKIILVNPPVLREFGEGTLQTQDVEKIAGSSEVYRPDGTPRPVEEAPPLLALRGKSVENQEEIVRIPSTGELRHRQVNGAPVRNARGEIVGSVCVVRDITDRKRAEARVAADLAAMTWLQRLGTLFAREGNLEPILGVIVEAAIAISGADFGNIQLVDPESSDLRIVAQRGFPGWWIEFWDHVAKGRGACGTALARGERVIVEDVEQSPIFAGTPALEIQLRAGVRAVQSTPLVSRAGQALGLFSTHYKTPRRPDDRTLRLLDLLARQAADIIERTRAEEALRESEEKYRELVENANSIIIRMDREGKVLYFNEFAQKFFGYSLFEVVGQDVKMLVPPAESGSGRDLEEMIDEILENPDDFVENTNENVRKDGERVWVSWRNKAIKNAQGDIVGNLAIGQDITERKKAEALVQALAEQERLRLGAAVEQASDAVVMIDLDGRIRYVNAAFESVNRMPRDKAVGGSYWELLADEGLVAAIRESVLKGEAWHGHLARPVAGGRPVELEVTISPATDPSGKVIGGLITERDVTRENALQQQVRQAQKMEALGTLAGGITHDFNNILGTIILNTEMSLLDLDPSHPARWPLPLVLQAANRGKDLVKQIITFSRQRTWERKPLEIAPVVKEGTKFLRSTLPKDVSIKETIDAGCGVVLADPSHIHQVLVNLCQNAALAMEDKPGQIELRLAPAEVDADLAARHPDLKPGPYVRLTVSDSGCGMTPEVMERIFEPFFTTRKHGEGSGLGLAVVHGIIKSYEGAITVYSEPGQGSTFSIYIPQLAREALAQGPAAPLQAVKGRERILLVEDEGAQRISMAGGLKRLGYKVTAKADGRSALAAFRRKPSDFDLVITDQIMPKMSGLELAEALVKVKPDIPVILCTGFSERVNGSTVGQSGIRQVVMKPFTLQEIGRAIRAALGELRRP